MPNPSNEPSAVRAAALWLATRVDPPRPVIPMLKARFGLSAAEACHACAMAADLRKEILS
jgi:hypothetical protein